MVLQKDHGNTTNGKFNGKDLRKMEPPQNFINTIRMRHLKFLGYIKKRKAGFVKMAVI